jgi:hypothetical protein
VKFGAAAVLTLALHGLDLGSVSVPFLIGTSGPVTRLAAPPPPLLARVGAAHPHSYVMPFERDLVDQLSCAGRVVATPVERGTPVTEGTAIVKLSSVETDASLKEAEANAAQIEARTLQSGGEAKENTRA